MADDKFYNEHDCTLDLATLAGTGPMASRQLPVLNPDYVPPVGRPYSPLQIRIFYTATEYKDFAPHWVNKNPLTIQENEGVIADLLDFTLEDTNYLVSNWPFPLQNGLRVMLVDTADGYCRFHGTIAAIQQDVFMQRPTNLTDIAYHRVTCKDFTDALSNNPVTEAYQNVREGFYLSDMVGRYAQPLSNAEMDPTMGDLTGRYVVILKRPSQEFQSAMLRNDWTLWINRVTLALQLKRRADAVAEVPVTVTDTNIWNLFNIGTFRINPVEAAYNNRVIMPWQKANRQGTVDVEQGTKLIHGTGCDFTDVKPGDTFRVEGSLSTYTVDHATQTPQEVWITSDYQETDATAVKFVILSSQDPPPIQIDDVEAQLAMAQLFNEVGELAGVRTFVAPAPNEPCTETEAEMIAYQYMRTQVYEGGAKTDTVKFPYEIQAGMGIEVNRYNFRGALIFRKIRWTYMQSGKVKPVFGMDISFTDPIADIDRQIRALLQEWHKAKLANDLVIRERKIVYERAVFGDCIQVVDPRPADSEAEFTDSFGIEDPIAADPSEAEFSDSYATADTPAGPFYTAPTARQAGYVVGFTEFGRCS